MIPLKRDLPMTSSVAACFLGLRGEARERAIATGNYDELVKAQAEEQQREPGQDDEERKPQRRSAFDDIDEEVPI